MSTLYSAILLDSLISSNFFCTFLRMFYVDNDVIWKTGTIFLLFQPVYLSHSFLALLHCYNFQHCAGKMLRADYLCLVTDFMEKVLPIKLAVGFYRCSLSNWASFFLYIYCSVFLMSGFWILSSAFSPSTDVIMWLFFFSILI